VVAKYASDGYEQSDGKVTMRVRVPEELFRQLKARQMELPYEISMSSMCVALLRTGLRAKEPLK